MGRHACAGHQAGRVTPASKCGAPAPLIRGKTACFKRSECTCRPESRGSNPWLLVYKIPLKWATTRRLAILVLISYFYIIAIFRWLYTI